MIRKIIHIDEDKCNGCGICADACHEGAIGMINGKAKLLRDDYCDGLGDCLPTCPTGAITFIEREAAAYDEAAVKANMVASKKETPFVCPGSAVKDLRSQPHTESCRETEKAVNGASQLQNWPPQLKLTPVKAPYFDGANLLIAADCTAFAYGAFHPDFMKNRITLIGCPKLDDVDYSDKISAILGQNDIASVSVLRMEVPCCGGLEMAVRKAIDDSGKMLPLQVVTISTDGSVL